MKLPKIIAALTCSILLTAGILPAHSQVGDFVTFAPAEGAFALAVEGRAAAVVTDDDDHPGVLRAAGDLKKDLQRVTGRLPDAEPDNRAVIIGTAGRSAVIDRLIAEGRVPADELLDKNEKYIITVLDDPAEGIERALVIAGSDHRGTIYGIYEVSSQIGVSPWYWWADVPVTPRQNIWVKAGMYTDGEPSVKYRGIFLNDEAPALSGWTAEVFGGFNSRFYAHVFELILRLKGNFLWPAMWGNALYDDDPASGALADEYGIVLGTSHHEPMGRAHVEWSRYGTGAWNYTTNPEELQEFWRGGMERMKDFETIVTVGMRGDGDEPMSREADIKLLERIVRDQRKIISKVTGKKAEAVPQVWALYKEVQDYYDLGMRLPDDVTLMLCDDNWGNVRKLPEPGAAAAHKGGYGMYYHFDYVGAPRNSKWVNISPVQRIWEQMNLTYRHGVDRIWVVNVGDLKPMEYPISFFLDMAWDPDRFNENNLLEHTEKWCARQFGEKWAHEAAQLIDLYTKYNRRVTPELLNAGTYSLENYNEFERVLGEYRDLLIRAMRLYNLLPGEYRDAFDELVLFPINGCCNLYEMYYAVAKNRELAAQKDPGANVWADKVRECFERDSMLTVHYNTRIAGGKWPHIMDQVRIGYTSWQEPRRSTMPRVEYIAPETAAKEKVWVEADGYVSIEAENFTRKNASGGVSWSVIPGMGRTLSAVTTMPVTISPEAGEVWLEYDVEMKTTGEAKLILLLSPTLNFNANRGLRYEVSIDGGPRQTINFNGHYRGELGRWQGEGIIESSTTHKIEHPGRHTIRLRFLDAGIVLQKLMLDAGGLKPSRLGAPQSERLK